MPVLLIQLLQTFTKEPEMREKLVVSVRYGHGMMSPQHSSFSYCNGSAFFDLGTHQSCDWIEDVAAANTPLVPDSARYVMDRRLHGTAPVPMELIRNTNSTHSTTHSATNGS